MVSGRQVAKNIFWGLTAASILAFTPIKVGGEESDNKFLSKNAATSKRLGVKYTPFPIVGTSMCRVDIEGKVSEQHDLGNFISTISKGEKKFFGLENINILNAGNSQKYAIAPYGMSGIIFFEDIYGTFIGDNLQKAEFSIRAIGSFDIISENAFVSKKIGDATIIVAGKSFFVMPEDGKCDGSSISSMFEDMRILYKTEIVDYKRQVEILGRVEQYEGNAVYFIKIKGLDGKYVQGKLMDALGNYIPDGNGGYKIGDIVYGVCPTQNIVGLWASK
ncbi:hypothetical protein COU37_02160 [Candidatus Micrarchaeota archaeon CG10_big_fil_rev_8_21_14_0_10_45_29]|nr:MAG: hypothetical protein COU37_02160 [Candidatus Micrarchaeota archaeon CG10_big_fil_rev_8_21_14_0_10_45_29]